MFTKIYGGYVTQSNDVEIVPAALPAVIQRCFSYLRLLWHNFPKVRYWPVVPVQPCIREAVIEP